MKQLLSIGCIIGMSFGLFGQKIIGGFKGGLNFTSQPEIEAQDNSIGSVQAQFEDQSTAYHVGMYLKLGLVGFYVRPELNYSHYKSTYVDVMNTEFSVENHRIDVPLLVGFQPIKTVFVHGGLVSSYYFGDENTIADFQELDKDDIQWGFQIGAGLQMGKVSLEGRYEGAFSERMISFASEQTMYEINSNPSQFLLSLGYQL